MSSIVYSLQKLKLKLEFQTWYSKMVFVILLIGYHPNNMNVTTTVGENIAIKYRSRDEILRSILEYAAKTEEISKTRIMYNSFLSYLQLNQYLNYLLKNELLHHNIGSNRYKITEKGLKLLSLYAKMEEMVKI